MLNFELPAFNAIITAYMKKCRVDVAKKVAGKKVAKRK
jgi:pentatricopeptide repeat protein